MQAEWNCNNMTIVMIILIIPVWLLKICIKFIYGFYGIVFHCNNDWYLPGIIILLLSSLL